MRSTFFLFFIILVSCNGKSDTKSQGNLSIINNWKFIRVTVDNHRFLVAPDKDTLFYINHDSKKVVLIDSANRLYDDKNVTEKYFLSKADRDSLLNYCYHTIVNPTTTESKVSDYAGQYVLIQIEKGQTQISCKYSSVSDWRTISPTLKNIERLTFGKLKRE